MPRLFAIHPSVPHVAVAGRYREEFPQRGEEPVGNSGKLFELRRLYANLRVAALPAGCELYIAGKGDSIHSFWNILMSGGLV